MEVFFLDGLKMRYEGKVRDESVSRNLDVLEGCRPRGSVDRKRPHSSSVFHAKWDFWDPVLFDPSHGSWNIRNLLPENVAKGRIFESSSLQIRPLWLRISTALIVHCKMGTFKALQSVCGRYILPSEPYSGSRNASGSGTKKRGIKKNIIYQIIFFCKGSFS